MLVIHGKIITMVNTRPSVNVGEFGKSVKLSSKDLAGSNPVAAIGSLLNRLSREL